MNLLAMCSVYEARGFPCVYRNLPDCDLYPPTLCRTCNISSKKWERLVVIWFLSSSSSSSFSSTSLFLVSLYLFSYSAKWCLPYIKHKYINIWLNEMKGPKISLESNGNLMIWELNNSLCLYQNFHDIFINFLCH